MARGSSSSDRDAGVAELLEVERYVAPWILPGVCAGGNLSQPRQVVIPARSVEGDGFRSNSAVYEVHDRAIAVGLQRHLNDCRLGRGLEQGGLPPPAEHQPPRRIHFHKLP